MSTATVQQISQDLTTWLGMVRNGETVSIVEQGEVIAQLSPPEVSANRAITSGKSIEEWMDVQDRRMQEIFGGRLVADSSNLLDEMRSDRE